MIWNRNTRTTATLPPRSPHADGNALRAMIDQATRDSLDESDEHAGLLSTIREEVACPFPARFARRGRGMHPPGVAQEGLRTQRRLQVESRAVHIVDICKLEWVEPLPKGHEWIEAYFAWRDLVG